jgi:quaternary ammonium compound-resistance protein SugE
MEMAWFYVIVAGILEIGWAYGLKKTDGFTRLWPSVATIACMILSFYFLSKGLRHIPIGTAYAIWTGIGAAGTAIIGILFLGEPRTAARLFSIFLILAGVIGLKVAESR